MHTIEESPLRSPWHAMSKAMRLLEQAESKLTLGPLKLKNQLMRFARSAIPSSVAEYLGMSSVSFSEVNR